MAHNEELKNLDKKQLELMAHCFNAGVYVSDLYNEIDSELMFIDREGGEDITQKALAAKIKLMGNLTLPCGINGDMERIMTSAVDLVEKGDYVLARQILTDVGEKFSVTIMRATKVEKKSVKVDEDE